MRTDSCVREARLGKQASIGIWRNLELPKDLSLVSVVLPYVCCLAKMVLVDSVLDQLRQYRPVLERIMFGLALLGLIDVVHLFIQKSRGFEGGCLGVSSLDAAPTAESTFDCASVTSGFGSELFGVSNLTWGFGFYLAVALLTVVIFWMRPYIREWAHGARVGLVTGGWGYSMYLVYLQMGPIDAYCALCLVSAVLVTGLFALQIATLIPSSSSVESPMPSRLFKRQVAIFAYLVVATLVLIGADATFFDVEGQGAEGQKQAANAASSNLAQCQLDPSKSPVGNNGAALIGFQDITKGNSDADVTIIEYFDPNCPHCKDFHEIVKRLQEEHGDEVRFVYKPFPLRASSVPEIQALYVAHQSGKFTQMLEGQYARQGPGGLNTTDLRTIAEEIGMDPNVLTNRIEQDKYREHILRSRKQAVGIGVDSTPTVLVNGHFVRSRSLDCMKTFIERAQNGTLGNSSS